MEYNFSTIESRWQQYWQEKGTYEVSHLSKKPKYYVLDMFPYPSGAGLHVGHPLGYIASDIYARYKRLQGFNVLHPIGFDAFGLPAEQYAIETGQHPAITTEINITRYKQQLKKIGFAFDWSRELRTSDPEYYKWTQHFFIEIFNHWYDKITNKAQPISALIAAFEATGSNGIQAACEKELHFTAEEWKAMDAYQQQEVLMNYRLAYRAETSVNWCPALGTVLANDEVKDGRSERGGHPVEQKKMMQWNMRITAYADRMLDDLNDKDWSDSLKEMQRNWIGRSEGAKVVFDVKDHEEKIEVFTTRPDTIFGVTFVVLAPENELVKKITNPKFKFDVETYIEATAHRSERDRMADVKHVSGAFTGTYALHPITGKEIPIWIADYVLAGYGTGAVMAVPGGDQRDWDFAKHFKLKIIPVIKDGDISEGAFEAKEGEMINSDFLNGLQVKAAMKASIAKLEELGKGKSKINFRLRDANFSRQRYWGEPIPVYYQDGLVKTLSVDELPLVLPEIDEYKPTATGEPPLARAKDWKYKGVYEYEHSTMPGWAGSSWYFLRYTDPNNDDDPFHGDAQSYWGNVDLYIGGSEHATGHLLYARFWYKFFKDLGLVSKEGPFQKLVNQGMIQGRSNFVYRIAGTNTFVSFNLKNNYDTTPMNVDVSIVNDDDILDIEAFKHWRPDLANAEFILEDGQYVCGAEIEKMSKSKYNVVTPDEIIERYGADTLRLYEMFLGPLEQSKPWSTKGIEGVHRFLKKLWRLYHNEQHVLDVSTAEPTKAELKVLHKTIKKVREEMERFSFNTIVSTLMVCVNELTELKCNKKEILKELAILVSCHAPHIAEELWNQLGYEGTIFDAIMPQHNDAYLVESSFEYPVSFNGKTRFKLDLPLSLTPKEVETMVLENEHAQKWLEGKQPKKTIVVPGKIVNIVV